MLPSEIVNSYITLLYLWGFRAYKSPAHFMWTTIRFTKNFVDGHHKHYSNTLTVSSCNLNWFETTA